MRYPTNATTALIVCPVHDMTVAVNDQGRIAGQCPLCRQEARTGVNRLAQRHHYLRENRP